MHGCDSRFGGNTYQPLTHLNLSSRASLYRSFSHLSPNLSAQSLTYSDKCAPRPFSERTPPNKCKGKSQRKSSPLKNYWLARRRVTVVLHFFKPKRNLPFRTPTGIEVEDAYLRLLLIAPVSKGTPSPTTLTARPRQGAVSLLCPTVGSF